VAARYHTQHHERLLSLDGSLDLAAEVAAAYDEPLADESAIPTYVVAQEVARDVKVVISGDGGDEIFAGYRWYSRLDRIERIRRRFGPVGGWLAALRAGLPAGPRAFQRIRRGLAYLGGSTVENYFRLVGYFDAGARRALLDPALAAGLADDHLTAFRAHWRPELPLVRRLQLLDLHTYLPDDILPKVDRASMRHSLETRVPLLDHRVVEHALKLPLAAVYRRGTGKVAFRDVAADLLPEQVLLEPKQGFGLKRPPGTGETFLAREARHLESGVLVRRGIIQKPALDDLLARRDEGRNPNRIWLLFALDLWLAAHHD